MSSDAYVDRLETLSSRIARLYEKELVPGEKTLVGAALEELSVAIEELRVADEEVRIQAEELASAHDAIEDQRYRYEEMFEFAPDGYVITDAFGKIQEANQAAARLFNISRRLLVGKPLVTFIPHANRQEFVRLLHRLEEARQVEEMDIRIQPRRGEPFDVAATLGVVRDRRGDVTARRWMLRDATARHMAEERRYQQIVAEIEDYAIFRLDIDGRIRAWNKGAQNIFGYSAEEIEGRHFDLIFTAEDRAKNVPQQELENARRAGRSATFSWNVCKDGTRIWADCVVTALHDSGGNVSGFVKIARDYTERKRAEDALSAAYEQQYKIADALQTSMLQKVPRNRYPGLEIEILYEAALNEANVGGDFFDTFALQDGRVALAAGDVSGKGLAAAGRTTEVQYALRAFLDEHVHVPDALYHLNNFICRSDPGLRADKNAMGGFVALMVAVIDPRTGEAEYAAAGTEPAIVLRSDGNWSSVEAAGMPLGVQVSENYPAARTKLDVGEVLLMATDGLTEVPSGEGFLDQAGLARLAGQAQASMGFGASLEDLGKALVARVTALSGGNLRDDACLLLARRRDG